MPGQNLTRDEASTRSDLVHVTAYDVDLDFSAGGETFGSVTEIRFTAIEPGAATFVDLVASRVREITLNGRVLDPDIAAGNSRITLAGLAADNVVRIAADGAYTNSGQGLHRTIDPVDGRTYCYTHFEVPDARRLYATFEQPDLKAPVTFTITAPAGWTILSNSPTPAPVPTRDGVATWYFAPTRPISTYLTAVIAGEYHVVRDTHTTPAGQTIPLAIACRASMAQHLDADTIFELTKQGFDYYVDAFAQPYPFAKYDQIFVPEYNIGAMENVGCVTVVEEYIFRSKATDADYQSRAEVLLHEMAHMWFGDLVTMRWWDDLWLKESFATYASVRCLTEATRFTHAWTEFANADKAWGLRQDELPSTHPIVADIRDLEDVAVNFDGITYAKGAAVLKQLVAWVGDEEFFAGVRHYFGEHAWGSTTLADLLRALEKTSGRDLSAWSREWLQTAGPNTLRPAFTLDDHGRFTAFEVRQSAPADHPTLRSHRIAIGLYSLTDGALVRTARHELDIVGASTPVPALVGADRPDLVLLNDDDLTYAKLRLDEASLSTLREHIGSFTDPLARALCWGAAWDMTRDAEWAATDFITLVLRGIGAETDMGVVETLLSRVAQCMDRFVAPAHLGEVTARVGAAARAALHAAAAGSDLQLAWARFLTTIVRSDTDPDAELALIAGLLDGSAPIDGLTIDTDLRWALVVALVRAGRLGAAEIEAEATADRTTAGAEYAAGALAARPTAEAKAAAWASVIDRDDLPNGTQDAIIGVGRNRGGTGFAQASQAALLEPYVERYFDAVATVWSSRSLEIGRAIVSGLYPRMVITQATVDRTDRFLAAAAPVPALRRLILEGRSDIVRALAARARDAAG